MDREHVWKQVDMERPVDGYGALTFRMRVPGGYLYKDVTMDMGGWGRAKFQTAMAFVPDPSEPKQ
jgi:hypothetical protein